MSYKFNPCELADFARFYGFHYDNCDPETLIRDCLNDMERGLRGLPSDLPMRPSYISPGKQILPGKTLLALDAGGTNLRAVLVKVDTEGKIRPGETRRAPMPGTQGRISAKAFFNKIADMVIPLLEAAGSIDGIGFCFSYSIDITEDADGILVDCAKEVDIPEVIGKHIGAGLREALEEQGFKVSRQIVLLNDTVATLLSGLAVCSETGGSIDESIIGFILGTGSNIAYLEKSIPKINFYSESSPQIINTETCNFCSRFRGYLDKDFDATTMRPGTYPQDKACSGAYLGPFTLFALKQAVKDKVISFRRSEDILALPTLVTNDCNAFLKNPLPTGPLGSLFDQDERDALAGVLYLAQIITERAALLSAAVVAATVERMDEGNNPFAPVRIAIEGSTYKLYKGMREAFDARLHTMLNRKKPRSYIISSLENASLFGAAMAALLK
ncbi:MAG: hexokinase [Spirochaetaceae bacterium]|jgi:hexokinase|nr:hexokinase [Spirochaetaceae bacterium]